MCDLLGICFLKKDYNIFFLQKSRVAMPSPPITFPLYNLLPHPSFTHVHQGICYVLLQSDNYLCIDVIHSKWFDQKSHVINKWNTSPSPASGVKVRIKEKTATLKRLSKRHSLSTTVIFRTMLTRTIISDLRVMQLLSARPPSLALNLPSLLPPQSSRPFLH